MPFGVTIKKDGQIEKFRQQVDSNLHNVALELDPNYFTLENQEVIKFVSFEDALKELVALKNS